MVSSRDCRSGVCRRASSRQTRRAAVDRQDDPDRHSRHIEVFIRHGRGGLTWLPAVDTPAETYALLEAHGIPTVLLLRPAEGHLDYVGIRNARTTAEATRLLVELGHARIAFLGGTDTAHVRTRRMAGYTETMESLGLGPPIVWPSADGRQAGMKALQDLRDAHPDVTAVVCNGDTVALGA